MPCFTAGLVRTKSVLGTMMHTFVAMAVIGVLWVVCGYSLTFGKSILGGFMGWNPDYFFLKDIDEMITDGIPEYIIAMFQGKFAIITPAAAVVQPAGALFLEAASAILCFYALQLKMKLGYDDTLDCFGIHGVGSGLGVILLSFFIRDSWLASASEAAGRTWTIFDQLWIQIQGITVTILLAASVTWEICLVVEKTIGFRIDREGEHVGLDNSLHGERGYDFS